MIKGKLLEKSKEAFVMAIEIYNKPTIKYRVEGFSFFICNAWELMLKAYMIKKFGEKSIYYKDNPNRTITLENCIKKIFTNEKAPLRLNIEKIIDLRNTSTHFVTEEYEMVYIPLFQACLFNFIEKMQEFHNIDMTEVVPQNFLTLAVSMKSLNESEIRAKYPEEIVAKLIATNESLSSMVEENNHGFAIKIEHHHYITKDKHKATSFVHIDKDAKIGVKIIKELKDPNDTHKYTTKACIKEINKRLKREDIDIEVNKYHFTLFCKYYEIKENAKLCYVHKIHAQPTYSYSMQTTDFIFEEIKKDPENIIQNIKSKAKK
ncbi:DUF3644 domain-containing protein [Marinisporobacter balticus]|uniref:Uncharacterized protein DUF3644 n=1 Tax=Marinisporobacter balticus TaxID=2018667 RepID=A0A4R2KS59_9FIRM|nr:DUF3644 domain-containing protein [Marinisporobacter balticus]TCO69485.1 uncharacterized protein DUF3644 [Marinisporobacter balticus]